jgi:DNA gyrase subunit B
MPGKLRDCQSNRAEECEVFIVEGDSAGGSAVRGRNPRTQAILPIRGKILNVERARLDRALGNQEVQALITAFGTGIGEDFDIDKLRYHKIVIMADADVDGQHIRTLLLTLLFRYMPNLITHGHVYLAQPPLYRIKWANAEHDYVYSDRERDAFITDGQAAGKRLPKDNAVQRYKGLGEMDYQELWETTMSPEHRTLLQVTLDEAAAADEIFSVLMGEDVESRRSFIQRNAKDVRFLDV